QRYWGEPFPILHEIDAQGRPTGAIETLSVDELPLELPALADYKPTGTPEPPLSKATDWLYVTRGGKRYRRETNTMPQWAGSCWYYLRYLDPKDDGRIFDPARERQWMAVDLYVGGGEHAVLHLLYARFWHKVLYDMGLVHTKEPFKKLRHQGTVLAYSYQDQLGRYHEFGDVEMRGDQATLRATGEPLKVTVEKMSKAKLNGVSPDDVVR